MVVVAGKEASEAHGLPAALCIDAAVKRYGRQAVLDRVYLDVQGGEYFALVGVNGAGKTTLIKALLDFCEIDGGNISIFGTSHRHYRARQRLAFLPERFAPPYFLKGRDFLRYAAGLYGNPFDEDKAAVLMSALDLEETALDKPVREFSKGMAQKLGLVACLLSGKDLLVLDEPMSGLDPKARALTKEHLLGLRDHGQTLFFSTHLLEDVEAMCDRIGVLHAGRMRFIGTPEECCERYRASSLEKAFLNCIESL